MAERRGGFARRWIVAAAAAGLALAGPAGALAGSTPPPARTVASALTSTTPTTAKATAPASKTTSTPAKAPAGPSTVSGGGSAQPTSHAKPAATKAASVKPAAAKKAAKKKRKAKPLPLLTGRRGAGHFPIESLILSVPRKVRLRTSQVHLSEDGVPIGSLSLTPMAQAAVGDFGFVVAIDQGTSLSAAELNQEVAAFRRLSPVRRAGQELGLITFGSTPQLVLPLTNNRAEIAAALTGNPPLAPGANSSAAASLALRQLTGAHDAAGAVVLISDGDGARSLSRATLAAASAAGIPIITIGLEDHAATPSSLAALQSAAPGPFLRSRPGSLPRLLEKLYTSAATGYVLHYRSRLHPGQTANVTVTATGMRGGVNVSFTIPRPPVHHLAKRRSDGLRPVSASGELSGSPSFAQPSPGAPAPAPAGGGFWTKPGSAAVIALLAALIMGTAMILLLRRPGRRAVRTRVGSFTAVTPAAGEETQQVQTAAFMRILERGKWWPKFVEDVDISRNERTPQELLKRSLIGGLVAGILGFLVTQSPLVVLLALFGAPFVMKTLVARAARKQRTRFQDLLPSHLQDLAGAMRAGRSVLGALAAVADGADEPIKSELERALRDEQLGLPLEETLETIARRMEANDMDQVALVAALNRRSGSNVAEALDRVAEGSRERADLRREVKALTGQAKMSSWILTGLPPLLLLGMTVLAPAYAHPLLHTTIGLVLLVVGGCMVFAGWKVMQKIINVKV